MACIAVSTDGLSWKQLTPDGQPIFRPRIGKWKGFRVPSVLRDRQGFYHMVWTCSDNGYGCSRSTDLLHWEEPWLVSVTGGVNPNPWKNVWAPEIFAHPEGDRFSIIWSATHKSVSHPNEDKMAWHQRKYDHRHYIQETRDWKSFTDPVRFPSPDISHIDGALLHDGADYRFFYKYQGKTWMTSAKSLVANGIHQPPSQLPRHKSRADFPCVSKTNGMYIMTNFWWVATHW